MDLIHSKNEFAMKASVNQLKGSVSAKVRSLREDILYEIAFIESALDDHGDISVWKVIQISLWQKHGD